jgi:putative inorganic carbon (hco3(-)) transporter
VTLAVLALPLLVALAVLGSTQRRRLVFALPFLAALHRLPITISGHSVRLDALAAVVLSVGLLPSLFTGQRRLYIDAPSVWLAVVLVLNIVSSVLFSPAKRFSYVSLASLMSVWAIYVVLANSLTTFAEIDRFLTAILVAGLLEALVGIIAFMLAAVGLDVGGATYVNATDLSNAFGAYGTMWEPNIFGGYCVCYLILSSALLWMAPHAMSPQRRQLVLGVAGTSALGLLLSFTRGAWLAAGTALVVLAVLAARRTGRHLPIGRIVAVGVALGVIFTVALMSPGQTGDFLRYKLTNLANPQSQSGQDRIVVTAVALSQWVKHPWLGLGTYSFAAAAFGEEYIKYKDVRALWIPSWTTLALHDTGVLGLIAFTAILVGVIWIARRASKRLWRVNRTASATAIGLAVTVFGTMIASLFSSSLSLGFPWMFMGLAAAYNRASGTLKPRPAPATRRPAVDAAALAAAAPR